MFDISKFAAKESTTVHLRDPDTEELLYADKEKTKPLQITVYGTESATYRNGLLAMQNRQLKRSKKVMSAEVLREEATELLVSCSISADNFDYKGTPLTTKQAWTDLYEDVSLGFIRKQVEEAQADASNFLKK